MPEQVALHQAFGDGRTVQRNQGAVASRAIVVDRPRDQLLARAALTHDADIGVTGGDFVDLGEDLSQLLRLSDDAGVQVGQDWRRPQRSLAHGNELASNAIEPAVALGHLCLASSTLRLPAAVAASMPYCKAECADA